MCETSNQSEEPALKRLSDLGEFDPAKADGSGVVIEEVTGPVAVQIIGGVQPHLLDSSDVGDIVVSSVVSGLEPRAFIRDFLSKTANQEVGGPNGIRTRVPRLRT